MRSGTWRNANLVASTTATVAARCPLRTRQAHLHPGDCRWPSQRRSPGIRGAPPASWPGASAAVSTSARSSRSR
ncbi:hypothetical protein BDZ31_000955 [Conexibacter arvalis]|uniref:Uncharacterized protein n=1 Tax=Conexibacter arvalis TaxID=912552 RepID=A0A840I9V3_9ACTN|nr:hypothetical protein [Conexibacter arvalis]